MCEICALTATFDPQRHVHGTSQSAAAIRESIGDASGNRFTPYEIEDGDSFFGTIAFAGDHDWIATTLDAGQTYDIAARGVHSGGGTLADTYLRLYDSNGTLLAYNDDGGSGFDSLLNYTASNSGTYYIGVSGFNSLRTGSYTVELNSRTLETATLDELADYLTDGYWEDTGRTGSQFDTRTNNQITVDITGLTSDGQKLAEWAFEAWELVADIEFVEVFSGADITFQDNDIGAYADSDVGFNGYITDATVNVSTSWISLYGSDLSSYTFATYIHEIGHALGLGHQGDYNGSGNYSTDATFANDSWQVSVMSYFSQDENPTTDASYAAVTSAMMADIVAIQNLYGAADSDSASGGDTTWGKGTELDGYFSDLLDDIPDEAVAFTIYDVDGTDTLNLDDYDAYDNRVDLNDESFSDVGGLIGNIGIARGTIIENATLGDGNDTVVGNDSDNTLIGNAGNDSLTGGLGADILYGEDGVDQLYGNAGEDVLVGGQGHDRLKGGADNDSLSGGGDNDTLDGGKGHDTLKGGSGKDTIEGGKGNDTLKGSSGKDDLSGGTGTDTLNGGSNKDTLRGDNGDDLLKGGSGKDILKGGKGDDTLKGDNGDDLLKAGKGDDLLKGGKGSDTLSGEQGNDTLIGGDGADEFIFDVGANIDEITDFELGLDILSLSQDLVGTRSDATDVIDRYATVSDSGITFDFGSGDRLILSNHSTQSALNTLADDIIFV